MDNFKILYRISDGGYKKEKLAHATKRHCLENALETFGINHFHVFADNCVPETLEMVKSLGVNPQVTSIGSSAQSWRYVQQYAFEHFSDNDIIYFLEDDYLHLPDSFKVLLEGIEIADYVTLYDHKDKYVDGINPMVKHGGEKSRVLLTHSTHWKTTNSTTMTFAAKLKTLKEDFAIWDKYTKKKHPNDFYIFRELIGFGNLWNKCFGKNRTLISPLPSRATHAETAWLAPLVDWTQI